MGDENSEGVSKLLQDILGVVSKAKVNRNEIHTKALDDLVNVNSLFSVAVFVGLAFENPQELDENCIADIGMKKNLVVYEVLSFVCFLFSSLVARSLKVYLNIYGGKSFDDNDNGYNFMKLRRGFMFLLSVLASIVGIVFLTLSMANVAQMQVGTLSCGSGHARIAVISLSVLVFAALIIYLPAMLIATGNCMLPDKYLNELKEKKRQTHLKQSKSETENLSLADQCCMPFILIPPSDPKPGANLNR